MQFHHSHKNFLSAQEYLVGGVNSPVRSFKAVGGHPLIIKEARGAVIYDEDGNGFTDYCLGWGALICGHAHRNVVLASKKTAERGICFGTTTKPEIDLAKWIAQRIPSIELIRFVNSGTEATMSAIRLARGFTKKTVLVKFDGCYHGHFDDLLIKAGSGVASLKESSSQGITPQHIAETISLPYNNVEILEETLIKHHEKIACVIIEPIAGNMGVIVPEMHFLKKLRELTQKYNIVLIFDEIITGFRFLSGGVQDLFNIIPDLTCLGKIIGGGFPIGAYGGRKDIMENLAPLGGVYQAGTFAGNPVIMRAGLATLKLLNPSFYESLNQRSHAFCLKLNQFFESAEIKAHASYFHSIFSLRFRKEIVYNYDDAQKASHTEIYKKLFWYLIKRGIYWPPADLEACFISGMHKKKDLGDLMEAVLNFFKTT